MLSGILVPTLVVSSLGLASGLGLVFASKLFYVKVDENVQKIRDILPGANCGACGYPGCDGFASALVEGEAEVDGCPVGGENLSTAIGKILGCSVDTSEKYVARVLCNGKCSVSKEKFSYQGIDDCFAAAQLFGGHKSCTYGCLGHGTCEKACPFDAIAMVGGIAKVIEDKCKSCKKCTIACPKGLIHMVPASKKYAVVCMSKDKGAISKKNCDVACIGCRKCLKTCKFDAIEIDGFLARINTHKCTNCGECAKACPTMAIRKTDY